MAINFSHSPEVCLAAIHVLDPKSKRKNQKQLLAAGADLKCVPVSSSVPGYLFNPNGMELATTVAAVSSYTVFAPSMYSVSCDGFQVFSSVGITSVQAMTETDACLIQSIDQEKIKADSDKASVFGYLMKPGTKINVRM